MNVGKSKPQIWQYRKPPIRIIVEFVCITIVHTIPYHLSYVENSMLYTTHTYILSNKSNEMHIPHQTFHLFHLYNTWFYNAYRWRSMHIIRKKIQYSLGQGGTKVKQSVPFPLLNKNTSLGHTSKCGPFWWSKIEYVNIGKAFTDMFKHMDDASSSMWGRERGGGEHVRH